MKIDLPIVIVFDANGITQRDLDRSASARVCTLRFNIADDNEPAELFDHYPPRENAQHLGEPGDPVLAMLSSRAYAAIKAKAARSPYDYLHAGVSDADRESAQADADRNLVP